MTRFPLLAAVLALGLPVAAWGQADSEFYATPKTAPEFWRAARFEIRTGSYERAAERIKGLLDLNPDDKTLFDLVDKPVAGAEPGMGQFLRLRNVPRWYADDKKDADAKKNVEDLIAKIAKAVEAELNNPERIRRYATALAGPPEESAFALKELRRSGKAVPPVIAVMLQEDLPEDVRAGILAHIPLFGLETVPGFVTFLPNAPVTVQADLIDSLRGRDDFKDLLLSAETDPVPTLWYLWGKADSPDAVKKKARDAIRAATLKDPTLERDPDLRTAQGQLTAIARRFYNGTANLPTREGETAYNVWVADGKTVKEVPMTRPQATEYYGLRYARWALDLQPEYVPAQKVFFGIAIEHTALRGGGGRPLSRTAPDLHAALATAPYTLLSELLDESIRDKKTAVVLAVTRVLADRTEVKAGRTAGKTGADKDPRPSLLVKALDYPDPRVQFVAADALLRIPGPPTHGRNGQIVKILASVLFADPEEGAKQKVLMADPDAVRAEGVATVLQRVGFEVEVVRTGRQLMRRLQEKADADLVIVDRHVPDPMLTDLLPQLRADRQARTRPLLVVASPEGITPVNLLTALARLAAIVSFEDLPDNPVLVIPEAAGEGAKKADLVERVAQSQQEMRRLIAGRHGAQMLRMRQLVEKAGFHFTQEMTDRIEYLSLQTFSPDILRVFAPELLDQERIVVRRLLPALVLREIGTNPTPALKGRIRADDPPGPEERERIVRLMRLTQGEEAAVPADRLAPMRALYDSFWDPAAPRLPQVTPVRHPEIELRLARQVAPYPGVRVIPAVFTEAGARDALARAAQTQAPPLTPAEKKENAKTALVWLRKMATGELAGYQVRDAEAALRGALKSDDLAPLAIDALVRLPSKDVQLDLANLAVAPERPVPIRTQAATALVEHIQAHGRYVTAPQADAIAASVPAAEDAELRAKLLAAQGVLQSDARGTGDRLKGYVPKPVEPAKEEGPPPKEKEKEDPKEKDKDPAEKK